LWRFKTTRNTTTHQHISTVVCDGFLGNPGGSRGGTHEGARRSFRIDGARSLFGQCVESAILVHIVAPLSAPYVIDGKIMLTRNADDPFANDFLFVFEEWFRASRWWWHKVFSLKHYSKQYSL